MTGFQLGSRSKVLNGDSNLEAQLISRLRRRDEHAFMDLYDRFSRNVYRFLLHMSGSIPIAEELTQEVFVVILNALDNLKFDRFDEGKGNLEGYILGIARNLARKELSRSFRLISLEQVSEGLEQKPPVRSPKRDGQIVDDLIRHSELELLHAAILRLPLHYRETIALCSLQEKSYQDAARILQCSEGTVASRINRAKSLLAEMLTVHAPNAERPSRT